ncbi:Ribosomal large subunit pseudouridine synthase B [Sulfitobacter indolifex]|uniref:Pseudouridine synthase n=1 Tax=Sulfitobacter indolifex HEL-45 TaxID=391624 RepID=A0ABP2D9Z0_9RHOB|nr:pseudouridine synthase [Sulfitobacter indolifex]EDQ05079.1 RNA pseudouridylate synthase family protein, putative [Sulfitobacter indolifex HEL-45]UOA18127.1 Ribosomal large subunit pseudouridine synthase B [Sulfitobacter indolifex]
MNAKTPPSGPGPQNTDTDASTSKGDRIAKVLSRAGVASRREAERMIEAGRVRVNGEQIDSPALNVTPEDKITVDNTPVGAPEPPRMWLYHKPAGLVTTARDEKGRETIFDDLPEDMPRVMTIGRLDLNSEGLLLLTNDGGVKRKLELPSTGWLRRYRARVNGRPTDEMLEPLRRGITVEGENFLPMDVTLDRQQGANAWLTIGLREGRNREIRRAMEAVGLTVNRLIRTSYGPFQLGELKTGEVEELRRKIVRDQLGLELEDPTGTAVKKPTAVRRPPRRKPGGFGGAGQPGMPVQRGEDDEPPPRRGGGKAKNAPRGKAAAGRTADKPGARPGSRTGGKPAGKPGSRGPKPRR